MDDWLMLLDGSRLPAREEIGGKAWSIARMRQLGLPVPPAFVLPTSACRDYYRRGRVLCEELWKAVRRGVAALEEATGRTFGAGPRPLLLAVRSGAAVSMPGMMDTVLDLGINDDVERALAAESGSPDYARDTHRRFVEAYGRIVLKADVSGSGAPPGELRRMVEEDCGRSVPEDPWEQLRGAIAAVFGSWQSARARAYRRHWGIPDDGGTAVTVQAMVFGNLDDQSGTGVLFTRNPLSGAPEPYGEYLPRGQGEDVVSGDHDPLGLDHLEAAMPVVYRELIRAGRVLEQQSGDAQDVEFTVERGRLYLLQTRVAKRSPQAAVRIAVDLVREGVITPDEALRRVTPDQVRSLLRPRIHPAARADARVVARGEPACPGVARGIAVADADEAETRAAAGERVVLVAGTTSPEHVHGMIAAAGVCTEIGGSTSHAAVVSRALGRPCVVGCGEDTVTRLAGQAITIDGETGEVFAGLLPLQEVRADDGDLRVITEWARERAPVVVLDVDGPLPDEVVDLDEAGIVDPEALPAVLAGKQVAKGRMLETDAGVRAAVAAGVRTIAVAQPLPALLASLDASGSARAGAVRRPRSNPVVR